MTEPAQDAPLDGSGPMTRSLTFLFAVAGGAAVGNLYWAQPLLGEIAASLGVAQGSTGVLVTLTQVGYAIGIFFLVPLGDVLDRRRFIPGLLLASALALGLTALVPGYGWLLVALGLVGLTSVAGQLLSPLGGDLADPASRGRVVGTISSGILIGILLSRTVSGAVADLFGWRAVYVLAAVVALVFAALLRRVIPHLPPRTSLPYRGLLLSVLTTARRHRAVLPTVLISSATFGTFSLFWTALTFLLSEPPYSYGTARIGLIGLAGLAGALAARRAGALNDKGLSIPATGAALALVVASLALAALGARSIVVLIIAIVLFDVAAQAVTVLGQTRLYGLDPSSRSRLNTVYITSNFVGGAIGSAVAAVVWHAAGWTGVCLAGAVLAGIALTVWAATRRGALAGGTSA